MKPEYKKRLFTKGAVALLLLFCGLQPVAAQPNVSPTDTLIHAFLPALGYNSDIGLLGGGIFSRYHYKGGIRPYYSYTDVNAAASTRGLFTAKILHNKPQVAGSDVRLNAQLYVSQFFQNQYYGIGNYAKLAKAPANDEHFYQFKSFSAGFDITLLKPVARLPNGGHFFAMGLINFDFENPWGNPDTRLIAIAQPRGISGGRTAALGAGILWENRNSEFAPTKGNYLMATAEVASQYMSSSYNYLSLKTDARAFISFYLLREITFANRVVFQHNSGQIPYWKYAALGGDESMRGYPENRFLDDNALYLNTELRTWLLTFPEHDVKLGGTLFVDMGRTFANGTALDNVFSDLKYTAGFGATSSFYTAEFILRIDVGFSEEGHGIYFTAGYLF